jgi:hypothetical protein
VSTNPSYKPVIILGAGRSGTNALRDCLSGLPNMETWPCDEIQPIWRYRNRSFKLDAMPVELATPPIRKFIRGAFDDIWKKTGKPEFVIEKTCANTLRVPFVDAIIEDAFYINLVRHGADIIPSVTKRWRGELEVPGVAYFAAKARYIPLMDMPSYLYSFISNRIDKLLGKKAHLSSWGPRFDGMEDHLGDDLDVICAMQWAACVTQTQDALKDISADRYITVYYEDLVAHPVKELNKILTKIGARVSDEDISKAAASVRQRQTNKGHNVIENLRVAEILEPVLNTLGYGVER